MAVRMRSFIRIAQWWGGVHSKPDVCLVKPSQAFWAPQVWVTWLPPVNVYFAMKFHGFPLIFTIYNDSLKTESSQVQASSMVHDLTSCFEDLTVQPLLCLLPGSLPFFWEGDWKKKNQGREIGGNWVCNIQNPLIMRLSVTWACYELPASSGISVVVCMIPVACAF